MQKAMYLGRLGGDPVSKQEGTVQKCSFSVAIDERNGKEKRTVWVNCFANGQTATNIVRFFKKGDWIYVEGKVWAGLRNSQKGQMPCLNLMVKEFSFAGNKQSQGPAGQYQTPANQGSQYRVGNNQGGTNQGGYQGDYGRNQGFNHNTVPTQQYPNGGYQPPQQPLCEGEPIDGAFNGDYFS